MFQPRDIITQVSESRHLHAFPPQGRPPFCTDSSDFHLTPSGEQGFPGIVDCPFSNRSVISFLEHCVCPMGEGELVSGYLYYPTALSFALTSIGCIFTSDPNERGQKDCRTSWRPLCHLAQQTVLCQQPLSKEWRNIFTSWEGWAIGHARWWKMAESEEQVTGVQKGSLPGSGFIWNFPISIHLHFSPQGQSTRKKKPLVQSSYTRNSPSKRHFPEDKTTALECKQTRKPLLVQVAHHYV